MVLIPWALPTTVMALGWRWIFNTPYGPLNQGAALIGIPALNILANPAITWMATVVGDVWKTTPFAALILLAGLQTIPSRQLDATLTPSIVTVGAIHGGLRSNIIPDSVEMIGTLRTFDADTPLGAAAAALYAQFVEDEDGRGRDFSAMLPRFEGRKRGD